MIDRVLVEGEAVDRDKWVKCDACGEQVLADDLVFIEAAGGVGDGWFCSDCRAMSNRTILSGKGEMR